MQILHVAPGETGAMCINDDAKPEKILVEEKTNASQSISNISFIVNKLS